MIERLQPPITINCLFVCMCVEHRRDYAQNDMYLRRYAAFVRTCWERKIYFSFFFKKRPLFRSERTRARRKKICLHAGKMFRLCPYMRWTQFELIMWTASIGRMKIGNEHQMTSATSSTFRFNMYVLTTSSWFTFKIYTHSLSHKHQREWKIRERKFLFFNRQKKFIK